MTPEKTEMTCPEAPPRALTEDVEVPPDPTFTSYTEHVSFILVELQDVTDAATSAWWEKLPGLTVSRSLKH